MASPAAGGKRKRAEDVNDPFRRAVKRLVVCILLHDVNLRKANKMPKQVDVSSPERTHTPVTPTAALPSPALPMVDGDGMWSIGPSGPPQNQAGLDFFLDYSASGEFGSILEDGRALDHLFSNDLFAGGNGLGDADFEALMNSVGR